MCSFQTVIQKFPQIKVIIQSGLKYYKRIAATCVVTKKRNYIWLLYCFQHSMSVKINAGQTSIFCSTFRTESVKDIHFKLMIIQCLSSSWCPLEISCTYYWPDSFFVYLPHPCGHVFSFAAIIQHFFLVFIEIAVRRYCAFKFSYFDYLKTKAECNVVCRFVAFWNLQKMHTSLNILSNF